MTLSFSRGALSLGVREVLMFVSKMADQDKIIVSHTYNGVSYVSLEYCTISCLASPRHDSVTRYFINIVRLERLKIDNDAVCSVVSCETSSPSVSIVRRASGMPVGHGISVMTSSFVSRRLGA